MAQSTNLEAEVARFQYCLVNCSDEGHQLPMTSEEVRIYRQLVEMKIINLFDEYNFCDGERLLQYVDKNPSSDCLKLINRLICLTCDDDEMSEFIGIVDKYYEYMNLIPITWKRISVQGYSIDIELLKKIQHHVVWEEFLEYMSLSFDRDFALTFKDSILAQEGAVSLVAYYAKTSDALEPFVRYITEPSDWEAISINVTLSEDFIREHQSKLNWKTMSIHQKLSPSIIREFHHRLNWTFVSYYQTIDKHLYLEFKDKIDWVTMIVGGKSEFVLSPIEFIDCVDSISESVHDFIKIGFKMPYLPTLSWKFCDDRKLAQLNKMRDFQARLDEATLTYANMERSVNLIIKRWKECVTNPAFKVCRNIVLRDIDELNHSISNRCAAC